MKVTLIDHQPNALSLLIFTKSTRLRQEVSLSDIYAWPMKQKLDHLEYMKGTIQSSFEFVRYTFNMEGVSRAFTHQLVRTRDASYAQESQRTVDVRDSAVLLSDPALIEVADMAKEEYGFAIDAGIPVQDARNVLPMGIETSITMNVSLRELMHMAEVRLCVRTQGEYQEVFKAIKAEVVKVHPYFESFIEVYCVKYGICCFPNYTECPIQDRTVKILDFRKAEIKQKWKETDHIANPKVISPGKTM